MKLEVGMYVRTDNGIIGKIYEKIGDMFTYKDSNRDYITYGLLHNEITKASYDIIDILECGDIIKLFMEDDIDEEDTNIFELIAINYNDNEIGVFNSDFQIEFFPIENLREILTHEQMEQKAYKVGE